jgi:hypothetical protein
MDLKVKTGHDQIFAKPIDSYAPFYIKRKAASVKRGSCAHFLIDRALRKNALSTEKRALAAARGAVSAKQILAKSCSAG